MPRRRTRKTKLMRRFNGGCDDCAAWTDLVDHGGGIYSLEIRHDLTCPAYARIVGRSA